MKCFYIIISLNTFFFSFNIFAQKAEIKLKSGISIPCKIIKFKNNALEIEKENFEIKKIKYDSIDFLSSKDEQFLVKYHYEAEKEKLKIKFDSSSYLSREKLETSEKSKLFIIRKPKYALAGIKMNIYIGKNLIGKLSNNQSFEVDLTSKQSLCITGEIKSQGMNFSVNQTLLIEPNKNYYLELELFTDIMFFYLQINALPENIAKDRLSSTDKIFKYIENNILDILPCEPK
jgi:hypothetical protein